MKNLLPILFLTLLLSTFVLACNKSLDNDPINEVEISFSLTEMSLSSNHFSLLAFAKDEPLVTDEIVNFNNKLESSLFVETPIPSTFGEQFEGVQEISENQINFKYIIPIEYFSNAYHLVFKSSNPEDPSDFQIIDWINPDNYEVTSKIEIGTFERRKLELRLHEHSNSLAGDTPISVLFFHEQLSENESSYYFAIEETGLFTYTLEEENYEPEAYFDANEIKEIDFFLPSGEYQEILICIDTNFDNIFQIERGECLVDSSLTEKESLNISTPHLVEPSTTSIYAYSLTY